MDNLSAGLEFLSQTDWSWILPYWLCLKELGNERLTVNPIVDSTLRVDVALIFPAQRPLSRPSQLLYDYFCQELQRTEEEWQRIMATALSTIRDRIRRYKFSLTPPDPTLLPDARDLKPRQPASIGLQQDGGATHECAGATEASGGAASQKRGGEEQ